MPVYMSLAAKQWGSVASAGLFPTSNSTFAALLGDALRFPPEEEDVTPLWQAKKQLERGLGGSSQHYSIGDVARCYANLIGGGTRNVDPHLNSLERIIMGRIQASGVISFREFMRLALYGPKGFYTQHVEIGANEERVTGWIGQIKRIISSDWLAYPKCDFTTSSEDPAFAEQMGRLVLRLVPSLRPGPIYFVELGGGSGKFAKGLLEFLQREAPDIYKRLYYLLYEISPNLAVLQRDALREHPRVHIFHASAVGAKIPERNVLVFSNELPDAFPVDVAFFKGDRPYLLQVRTDGRYFLPTFSLLTDEVRLEYLKRHGYWKLVPELRRINNLSALLAAGIPINLDMEDWYRRLLDQVLFGAVITIDYGFVGPEDLQKRHGITVVRTYGRRKLNGEHDPFWAVGETDMTSEPDFRILEKIGEKLGAQKLFFGRQSELLGNTEKADGYFALVHGKGLVERLCLEFI